MKLLLKVSLKIAGLLITLSVLFAAFTVITERANGEYAKAGSYSSELLTWEQEHPGEGTLKIFGNPLKLNLDALSRLKSGFESGVVKVSAFLPESARTAVQKTWVAISAAAEAVLRFIF